MLPTQTGSVRQSMSVDELRAAVDDAAMARGAQALYLPSTWHAMDEIERAGAESHAWFVLKAVFCDD